ncbi:MAG: hypothetical protein ACXABY_27760 [Candidatus Thorarchaeota archaeon]|jgi:hypothetical protein
MKWLIAFIMLGLSIGFAIYVSKKLKDDEGEMTRQLDENETPAPYKQEPRDAD